jgi:hypothetical protein
VRDEPAGMNGQNTHGVLRFGSCSRTGIVGRFLAAAAFLTGISEIRQWWVRWKTTNIKSQGSGHLWSGSSRRTGGNAT